MWSAVACYRFRAPIVYSQPCARKLASERTGIARLEEGPRSGASRLARPRSSEYPTAGQSGSKLPHSMPWHIDKSMHSIVPRNGEEPRRASAPLGGCLE
jgi:hypothetical protein